MQNLYASNKDPGETVKAGSIITHFIKIPSKIYTGIKLKVAVHDAVGNNIFLACLYKSTGRAIALPPALALASVSAPALTKFLKPYIF